MDFHTLRNVAVLGLSQVGVIVATVLGAGACHKWYVTAALAPPAFVVLLTDYGFYALAVPVVWVALATAAAWAAPSGGVRGLAYGSGFVVLVLLLLVALTAVAAPCLRLFQDC